MAQPGSELDVRADLNVSEALSTEGWKPQTIDDLRQMCVWVAESGIAPPGFNTPQRVFIGLQTAMEAGLPMMTGLRMQYIVHNIPSWLGVGVLALIRSKGVCDQPPVLRYEGEGAQRRAIWRFKRKDMPEAVEVGYSWEQAVAAGYSDKDTYKADPDGMISWRAVSRMGDRYFSDVLCGLGVFETVRDYPPEAFQRVGVGELPSAVAPAAKDPLMVGAGQPAAQEPVTRNAPSAEPAPAPAPAPVTVEPPATAPAPTPVSAPEAEEIMIVFACPDCGAEDAYPESGPFVCTSECGCVDVRPSLVAPEPATEPAPTTTITLAQLRKMLKRVGVTVAGKVTSAWTQEQCVMAYNWAYDEQSAFDAAEAGVGYEREFPERPTFLPAQTAATAPPTSAAPTPAAAAAPAPAEEPDEPSPFSTPGGMCITARQAGALRGMAQNRCTELSLKSSDARHALLRDALGCDAGRITEDMYEAAKIAVREYVAA